MLFLNKVFNLIVPSKQYSPVYVFHHIPKCGGTSLIDLLRQWFNVISDYRDGWTMNYPKKINLFSLPPNSCICGHFELDGYYLYQRYPEILTSERYRLLTFLRDPLDVKLSLYRYEMQNNVCAYSSLEECILSRPNYIAERFPVTVNNYKGILDKYYFIGILEHAQECINILSKLLNKTELVMPCINTTLKEPGLVITDLSSNFVRNFKNENKLDYAIYDYARRRFDVASNNFNKGD